MADPVLIVIVAVCVRAVMQLADVLAYWLTLRARIELARIVATAPPGTEIIERDRRGRSWHIRLGRVR